MTTSDRDADWSSDDDRAGDDDVRPETGRGDANGKPNADWPPMEATRYADGSITYPHHPVGPEGAEPVETIDLSAYTATVVTWTTSTSPPPGVRDPNTIAIVEFDVDGEAVRAIGQVVGDVEIGASVRPVYVSELRDPDAGIREPASQAWDGYRFEPASE